MNEINKAFFDDNIVNVNIKVGKILFGTIFVPICFFLLSFLGIWVVPYNYSLLVLCYAICSSCLYFYLRKRNINQVFLMYLGILFSTGFVFLLGYKGIIVMTISFAFPAMLSYLYYNRRLTKITTVFCFLLSVLVFWIKSYTVPLVINGIYTQKMWFIKNTIGLIIENVFLLIITGYMADRTRNTLQNLVHLKQKSEDAYEEIIIKNQQLDETQYKIIKFVAECLGSHDLFTGRHVMHTQKYVEIICQELVNLGHYTDILTPKVIELYKNAAFLHDIGKIHIPEGVLNKIGKYTEEEFAVMKSHAAEGYTLLDFFPIIEDGSFNEVAKQMAYYHHEKWDGSGYPNGIKGKEIPLCARIMAAADVLDALLSQRLYKDPMSMDQAIRVFVESRGKHFEPCIVDAVINQRKIIENIDNEFKNSEATSNQAELEWWYRYHQIVIK